MLRSVSGVIIFDFSKFISVLKLKREVVTGHFYRFFDTDYTGMHKQLFNACLNWTIQSVFRKMCFVSFYIWIFNNRTKKSGNVFVTSISLDRGALVAWDRKLGVDKYQGDFCVIGSVSVMDELQSLSAIRKKSLFWLSLFIIFSFWISMLILWCKRFLLIF